MRDLTQANVTGAIIRSFDETPDARLKEVMGALVRHIHGFAQEVHLTQDEWTYAMDFLFRAGKISDGGRNEFVLFSDTLGLSALVDLMNGGEGEDQTRASQLGPFFVDGLPLEPSAVVDLRSGQPGEPVLFTGTVMSRHGQPIPAAQVDVWQTDHNGLYDSQIPGLGQHRFRCRLRTDPRGQFTLKTIKPLGYTAPMDGPGGEMLTAARRNIWRPGHYHFRILADGHRPLVTELFPEGDKHLDNDVAFGVRAPLIIDMPLCHSAEAARQAGMPVPYAKVDYTFRLTPQP
jgi:hydroxyquinol 1,2-dioxygenase